MAVERVSGSSSLVDVLDRILDKGMVIDAWTRISLPGIDLREARLVVASLDLPDTPHLAPAECGPAKLAPGRARGGSKSSRGGRKRGHG